MIHNSSAGIYFGGTPSFAVYSVIFSARSIGFAHEFEGENAVLGFNTVPGSHISKAATGSKAV